MNLTALDLSVIAAYLLATVLFGFYISRRASKDLQAYFLGGNRIKWYILGLSNASGMFDISGTMWTVTILFVYGLKSVWIPWLWPVWNQVVVMVFLAVWLRRSGVMTGAQWITFRFGDGRGGRLAHIIVTVFAIVSVLGFIAYFFEGIGKFATIFFPWDLSLNWGSLSVSSEQSYALIIIAVTTLYTIKGGMFSVVGTEVMQFAIMTISCFVVGYIAFTSVTGEQIAAQTPEGWDRLFFGWRLDLDWTGYLESVNAKIADDGFSLFGLLVLMMVFKGIFASLAGPVPSYDMQRVLSTRTPREAAKMSGLTILALYFPRYLMIGGFAFLAMVYLMPEFQGMGSDLDFEVVLPMAIDRFVPPGFQGLLLAGLLAAFMGTFAAFINAAPAYIVNDLYKKYIHPEASDRTYVRYSYLASFALVAVGVIGGFFAGSINALTLWITSALYGGYAAANVLKWIWWRFNGLGYFWGMLAGLLAATLVPQLLPGVIAIYLFPLILLASFLGCLAGTYAGPPEDPEVLKNFYRQTNPWGFWGPVRKMVLAEDPGFTPNRDFRRDLVNVAVGIVWQMTMIVMPLYLLMREVDSLAVSVGLFLLTTYILKRNWYDRL